MSTWITCCFFIMPTSQGSEQAEVGISCSLFQTTVSMLSSRPLNHFPTTLVYLDFNKDINTYIFLCTHIFLSVGQRINLGLIIWPSTIKTIGQVITLCKCIFQTEGLSCPARYVSKKLRIGEVYKLGDFEAV